MTTRFAFAPLAIALAMVGQTASAGVFDIDASIGSQAAGNYQAASASYTTVDNALNAVTDQGLNALLNQYNGTQQANLNVDFRGVPMQFAFPQQNSTLLTLVIPAINVDQSFQGTTRNDSQQQLKDYLKKNPQLLSELQKVLSQNSPADPFAGNPNSMMSRGVAQDFGNTLITPAQAAAAGAKQQSSNQFGFSIDYQSMVNKSVNNPRDMNSDSLSLPLSYKHQFETPGQELDIYLPLGETTVQGAKAYDAGLNVAYHGPVNPQWYLAVAGGIRATGSKDLGTGVAMTNFTLTSSYVIPGKDWSFTIGNMIGQYSSMKVKVNDASYDPGIHNTVFRNGVLIEQNSSVMLLGQPTTIEYTIVDTRFTGTTLFNKSQDEFGITFGSKRAANARTSDFRGGLMYTTAQHSHGWGANFGYWF
ncbi:MAG: hypothetical protein JO218_04320 [Burkholderiales bacterium]|nr:hypothetical protein [Burkholderiales bacterium]